jgi:hemerythrin-like domain-containing protein
MAARRDRYPSATDVQAGRTVEGTAVAGDVPRERCSDKGKGETRMNIIQLLTSDHRKVDEIINGIKASDGANTQLVLDLETELKMHTQIEESIFYPELRNNPETADLISEAYKEHDEVDQILARLKDGDTVDITVLGELADSIHHHVDEEETELFPKASQVLGEGRLIDMGKRASAMKQSGLRAA